MPKQREAVQDILGAVFLSLHVAGVGRACDFGLQPHGQRQPVPRQPAKTAALVDTRRRLLNVDDLRYRSVGSGAHAESQRAPLARLVWSWAGHGDGYVGLHNRGGHDPVRYGCASAEGSRCLLVGSVHRHDHLWLVHRDGNLLEKEAGIPSAARLRSELPTYGPAIGRFDFMFNHNLFYPALDCIIVLGMVRDWVVDKRVHKVYLYALPSLIVVQSLAIYAWRINPNWWQGITQAIMGL